MNPNKIYPLLGFIFFFNCSLIGQPSLDKIELNQVIVKDSNLIALVDSFLISEQSCDYYTDSLFIVVNICNWNRKINEDCQNKDGFLITIESVTRRDIIFGLNENGFFIFQKHLCFINGILNDDLFTITNDITTFEFNNFIHNTNKDKKTVIEIYNDDSHSIWVYFLTEGKLILESKTPNCPR